MVAIPFIVFNFVYFRFFFFSFPNGVQQLHSRTTGTVVGLWFVSTANTCSNLVWHKIQSLIFLNHCLSMIATDWHHAGKLGLILSNLQQDPPSRTIWNFWKTLTILFPFGINYRNLWPIWKICPRKRILLQQCIGKDYSIQVQ